MKATFFAFVRQVHTFVRQIDTTQVIFWVLLGKLFATSNLSYPEATILFALTFLEGYKFYVVNTKVKPLAETVLREVAEIKAKTVKIERDIVQHASTKVKPPTQQIWG
jgi:hypothetical protein